MSLRAVSLGLAAAAALAAAGCGKSDASKVEDAVRAREARNVVHSADCHRTGGRHWRCVLRIDSQTDSPGDARATELCDVTVGSDASRIAAYECGY